MIKLNFQCANLSLSLPIAMHLEMLTTTGHLREDDIRHREQIMWRATLEWWILQIRKK